MNEKFIKNDSLNISHQLTLMFIIFVIGFSLLALINYYSSVHQRQLDSQLENVRAQGVLGSEIINHINQLESSYYRITTQLNPQARTISLKEVDQWINDIYRLIGVLNVGGEFKQTLILNLPDKDNFEKHLRYSPVKNVAFDILKIDILPKLVNLREQFLLLNQHMDVAYQFNEEKNPEIVEQMTKIQFLIKNTVPLFIRLLENTNRVHYEQQLFEQELTEQVNVKKMYFEIGSYAATLLLFLLTIVAIWVISRHITQMAQVLNEQKNHALAATQSKSVFLANMSHEIRTPLNAITGFIGLLKQGEKDSTKLKYLHTIEDSSASLIGIINDILDFSKIESNKLEIELVDFNPHTAFNSVADLFKARSSEKNITLHVNIDQNLPQSLHSDPLRIKQVLTNLLSNAVKFTEANRSIYLDISYYFQRHCLHVSVTDQGIGISEENQRKIFQPFSQAESHTTRKFGGTGLGLTISRLLVELLGGKLELESKLDEGSRFFFSIPAKIGKTQVVEAAVAKEHQMFTGRLLLVEDNHTNQLLMGAILKKLGVEFDLAKDGLEAVEAVKIGTYDLVLMDENMPNMSGSEATQKIRELEVGTDQRMPIVALTANAMKGDKERFLAIGMDDYLHKPIVLDELKRVLALFLKS